MRRCWELCSWVLCCFTKHGNTLAGIMSRRKSSVLLPFSGASVANASRLANNASVAFGNVSSFPNFKTPAKRRRTQVEEPESDIDEEVLNLFEGMICLCVMFHSFCLPVLLVCFFRRSQRKELELLQSVKNAQFRVWKAQIFWSVRQDFV